MKGFGYIPWDTVKVHPHRREEIFNSMEALERRYSHHIPLEAFKRLCTKYDLKVNYEQNYLLHGDNKRGGKRFTAREYTVMDRKTGAKYGMIYLRFRSKTIEHWEIY